MAQYCPDCKQLFESRHVFCPLCGYYTVSDDRPIQAYLDMGYSRYDAAPRQTNRPNPIAQTTTSDVSIDDDDLIEQLRKGFQTADNSQPAGSEQPQQTSTGDNFFGSYHSGSQRPAAAQPPSPQPESAADDFFGSYHSGNQQPAAPTPPSQQEPEEDDFFGGYYSNTPRAPTPTGSPRPNPVNTENYDYRVPHSSGNGARRFFQGLGRIFTAIPWRIIFRIILIAVICFALYYLWQMREVILSSVLNFLISLIPAVLVIAVIVWLFRKMFH